MKPEEALQVLGVPPGSSPEEIRRAYSRKTRTWNPAADPDGLRRLRAAHDLLLADPSLQPPPLPPLDSQQPPPLPPSFTAATSELPPPLPQERRIQLLNIEPDPPAEGSPLLRVLAYCGGGLFLLIALWLGLSQLQESNTPQKAEVAPVIPSLDSRPAFAGYATVQEGMGEVCGAKQRTDFCRAAAAILQATAQRKCSDAKAIRKRIEEPARYIDPELDKGRNPRTRALRDKLDEEIARCWKFWNP
jgi:hypothetical protein